MKIVDVNYLYKAPEEVNLEFTGNIPITGKLNLPLKYEFIITRSNFEIILKSSIKLEGVNSDWCYESLVKPSGNL